MGKQDNMFESFEEFATNEVFSGSDRIEVDPNKGGTDVLKNAGTAFSNNLQKLNEAMVNIRENIEGFKGWGAVNMSEGLILKVLLGAAKGKNDGDVQPNSEKVDNMIRKAVPEAEIETDVEEGATAVYARIPWVHMAREL